MSLKHLRTYKQFIDNRGVLGVVDDRDIPFKIKRVFWISNVPADGSRGHHSHRECEQVVVCAAGHFCIWLDGTRIDLNCANNVMVRVPTDTKIILNEFSSDAVCLVLCSEYYDENEVEE